MPTKKYTLTEIYQSIQGEGSYTGQSMIFIRFAGCNLACSFCDTSHEEKEKVSAVEIVNIVDALARKRKEEKDPPHVCFTGGEPTLQLDRPLIEKLMGKYLLHLETNGTRPLPCLPYFECVTISPKGPPKDIIREQMCNVHCNVKQIKIIYDTKNPATLARLIDAWEFVAANRRYLQPCDGPNGPNISEVLQYVQEHPHWMLSVQLHKMLKVK